MPTQLLLLKGCLSTPLAVSSLQTVKMQLLSIIALALPAFVAAQDYGAPPPDPTTTSSSAVPLPTNVHLVSKIPFEAMAANLIKIR